MNRVPVPATPVDSAPDRVTERLGGRRVPVPELVLAEIAASGAEVLTDGAPKDPDVIEKLMSHGAAHA